MSFGNEQSVFLQTLHHYSVSRDVTLLFFFIWIFACFGQTDPIKVQFFGLSTSRMKINQISYVIFQPTSQFPLKLCNTLQCHNTFLWNFLAEAVYALDKKSPSMYNFQTFGSSNDESSPNSPCHFWNHKVRVFQILHHCLVSWKITPLYFFSSNLIYSGQE